ncbi:hypothetical protein NA56DRAFT_372291 [Hyaloscypha hepaticicola]|uniref:Uncharacterized protein n=1 Tax=Hyaloscypha hepaticicola TaxID=2082293 RepID=A0A2J6PKZ3_9HELO|nr:hypothetical protein NA56DRAFT_372291 [Hyaloscypha hepaticicola]
MSGRRMGIEEAYSRADDNEEIRSEFRPRAAQDGRSVSTSSTDAAGATESRIPRSTTYSLGSSLVKSSPPKSLKGAYARAEAEEQAAIDARLARERAEMERVDRELAEREARAERERIEGEERLADALEPVDYESESTGPRATSPSPAARPATRPAYLQHARPGSSEGSSSSSLGSNKTFPDWYTPPDPVKEAQWEANRIRKLERAERDKRYLELSMSKPLYFSGRSRHNESRYAEAKAILERKAAAEAAGEKWDPKPAWGFKSRRTEAWMRRILNPNDPLLATFDPPASSSSNTDVPRSASADIPRPSVEVGPSAQPTPPSSRPSSAQPTNGSPEKSKMWDADIDFTAHSLQGSTSPLLRVKNSKLDDIRQREIQSLTARAVATNRLEEIRERNSEERSVLSESSRTNSRLTTSAPIQEPQEEVYHERTILEEEGEQIPNTPITIFAKGLYRPSSSSSAESDPEKMREESFEAIRLLARKLSPGPQKAERLVEEFKEQRAERLEDESKEAEEPRNDQKKESGTKIPKKFGTAEKIEELEVPEIEEKKRESGPAKVEEKETKSSERLDRKDNEKPLEERKNQFKRRVLDVDDEMKRRSTGSTPPKSDVDPEERITAEAKLFELPDNKSERNSIRAPSRSPSPSDDGKYDETPRPKADPLSLPTPKVTGAYIETPAPSTRRPRKSRSISPTYEIVDETNDVPVSSNNNNIKPGSRRNSAARPDERAHQTSRNSTSQPETTKQQSKPRTSRPAIINTATPASVAEDLRSIAMEEQYEDSTLDDFENMLESDVTTQLMNNTTIPANPFDLEYDERGYPLSAEERERRLERLRLDRMNQQLKNTSFSIRDAKHGIERLEQQVASSYTPTPVLDDQVYIQINLKIPVPRLVVSTPIDQNRGPFGWRRGWKFTWVGLIMFLFGLWYVAESAMCSVYCHPKQSSRNTWQPSDPFFPWAIPTKLDQWTGNVGGNVLKKVVQWIDIDLPNVRGTNGYMGANDWWEGRNGPAPIVSSYAGTFDDDEYI